MRKIFAAAACILLLSAAAAHAEELKIAVFNMQKVVSTCDALQEAKNALEKAYGSQKAALEKQRAALEKKVEGLKGKVTEQQRVEMQKMQREYSEKANTYMQAVQADEMRIRKDIDTVIVEAGKELAKKKGYNLILDSSTAAIYADESLDVTNDMLNEANLWWKNKTAKK